MSHIVILGAGISGLATAWFLKQRLGSQSRLTVIEKSQRPGGWIQTLQTNEFLFEQGPRSCRTKGAGHETLALIESLGLQDQVITPHSDAKTRYVYNGQHLQPFPKHMWEIPFNPLTRSCLKALWRDWLMPRRQVEDESIQSFFNRRLGNSWTENLIDPFVSGIYAGDCSQLSLKSCFPLFDQWEQQSGSLLRGGLRHRSRPTHSSDFVKKMQHFPMFSFQEGMETLPRALARELGDCLSLGQKINSLKSHAQGIEIQFDDGKNLIADHVISTLPTFALSSLIAANEPLLAAKMKKLSYTTVVVANAGFCQNVLPLKGFGYLVPSRFGLQVLGCVWDSCIFPQHNHGNQTRLTVMLGGSHHPEVSHMSEEEIIEQTLRVLREHLSIQSDPQMIQINKAQFAIPQFEVGYSKWKEDIQEQMNQFFPRLTLSGSAWTGVSINDCIEKARHWVCGDVVAKIL